MVFSFPICAKILYAFLISLMRVILQLNSLGTLWSSSRQIRIQHSPQYATQTLTPWSLLNGTDQAPYPHRAKAKFTVLCFCASILVKSGLENRDYGRTGSTDHATPLYPQKLALTSPTSDGRSVGIVRSRTKATELVSVSSSKKLTPWPESASAV
jgi:hypothetical protein